MKTIIVLVSLAVVIGCSGGDEVTDKPLPVGPNDKNQYQTTIDKGAGVTEDGAPRGKGGSPEGAG